MNILLLNTYKHGGAGIACRRLQASLQSIGESAELLTVDQVPGNLPFYAERLSFLPYERDKSVRFAFSLANFGHDLRKHPAVQAADILHLHWINQGFLSLKNIQQLGALGKPIVWTLHDMWAFTGGCHYSGGCKNYLQECGNCPYLGKPRPQDLSHRIWKRKKHLFPKNIQFVTCSEWLAETARQSNLLQHYNVMAIPNPIDTQVFKPLSESERLVFRQSLGITEGAFVLLFVSVKVQEERKGFRYFREALENLKKSQPTLPISLLVMGRSNSDDLASLPYPSHALGMVTDQKILTGAYSVADAFVIPSLEDNLPNTVMESLACGTPVVGFQTGGIPEMVDHHVNGFIAEQGDSLGLAKGLAWIFEKDATERNALRNAAREKVEMQFANDVVAKRHIGLYRQLLLQSGSI